jgi:hypothetical protein
MNVRRGIPLLALPAALALPVAHASAACEPTSARFTYTLAASSATFTVRPACFGSRTAVGDLVVHYTGQRCDIVGCTELRPQTVVCRWSTRGCTRTLTFEHDSVERADYTFGMDYLNSPARHTVAAGADSETSSCTALGVTFVCA